MTRPRSSASLDDVGARARRLTTLTALAAGTVLAVAAAGVIAAVAWWPVDASPPAATPTPSIPTPSMPMSSTPTPSGPRPSATSRWGGDTASSSVPPAADDTDLIWTDVGGAQVPISSTSGPREVTGGRARGFSRDSDGAVFAALHLTVRLTPQLGPAVFRPTLAEQVLDPSGAAGGPDVTALRERIEADHARLDDQAASAGDDGGGGLAAVVRGYAVDAASPPGAPTAATVRLLIEATGADGAPVSAVTVVQLRWHPPAGDWVLVAPPDGDWSRMISPAGTGDRTGLTLFPTSFVDEAG